MKHSFLSQSLVKIRVQYFSSYCVPDVRTYARTGKKRINVMQPASLWGWRQKKSSSLQTRSVVTQYTQNYIISYHYHHIMTQSVLQWPICLSYLFIAQCLLRQVNCIKRHSKTVCTRNSPSVRFTETSRACNGSVFQRYGLFMTSFECIRQCSAMHASKLSVYTGLRQTVYFARQFINDYRCFSRHGGCDKKSEVFVVHRADCRHLNATVYYSLHCRLQTMAEVVLDRPYSTQGAPWQQSTSNAIIVVALMTPQHACGVQCVNRDKQPCSQAEQSASSACIKARYHQLLCSASSVTQ